MASKGVNAPLTSSAGRLFDAVAAILGIRDSINYEGQAAIELEQRADLTEQGTYPAGITEGSALLLHGVDLVRAVVADHHAGTAPEVIATRFHHGLADAILRVCLMLRETTGMDVAALSGGVFQNVLLLERTVANLEQAGFRVLTHSRVPPNDAGISLGQVAVAAATLRG
jgi:hydrogenase maturation protein HypF